MRLRKRVFVHKPTALHSIVPIPFNDVVNAGHFTAVNNSVSTMKELARAAGLFFQTSHFESVFATLLTNL